MKRFFKILGWLIGLLIVAAVVLRLFVVDLAQVEGTEMFPSMGRGSWLLVNRLAKPRRGDLVMMKKDDKSKWIVRRVIGLPGEKVSVVGGKVQVGKVEGKQTELRTITVLGRLLSIERESLEGKTYQVLLDPTARRADVVEQPTGDGYYVLADNRDHAEDSRGFGAIAPPLVRGVVLLALTDGEGP